MIQLTELIKVKIYGVVLNLHKCDCNMQMNIIAFCITQQ